MQFIVSSEIYRCLLKNVRFVHDAVHRIFTIHQDFKAVIYHNTLNLDRKDKSGRIFIGGLVEGRNFARGKKTPIINVDDCSDIIIVSSDYFLKNKELIEAWAMEKILK